MAKRSLLSRCPSY